MIKKSTKAIHEQKDQLERVMADFCTQSPSPKNAFDLFSTSWSTAYADVSGKLTSGHFPGLHDTRIKWLIEKVEVSKSHVLELGPLEGAHSIMLERAGAKVRAIEANIGAFMRCLVVKNHFNLNVDFILGDFTKMDFSTQDVDLVVASGVLYHLDDPVAFLVNISKCTDKLFIWSHYFEQDLSLWADNLKDLLKHGKWDYQNPEIVEHEGLKIRLIKQYYRDALNWSGFSGGTEEHSKWIVKEDFISLLPLLGFNSISIEFDNVQHQNGPAFCVLAQKMQE